MTIKSNTCFLPIVNCSRKIVGAIAGAVTGGCLVILVLGTSVVILMRQNVPPQMHTFIEAALAKGMEGVTIVLGGGVTGGVTAGASAAAGQVAAVGAVGAVGGVIIGWEAAEDADSMYDAMTRATDTNFEMAKHVIENVHQFTAVASKANKMSNAHKTK